MIGSRPRSFSAGMAEQSARFFPATGSLAVMKSLSELWMRKLWEWRQWPPDGEEHSGQPTIVAIYVHPDHRRNGYGKMITEAIVRRCIERIFSNIRMDAMSGYAMRAINALPAELRAVLDVHDFGDVMDKF